MYAEVENLSLVFSFTYVNELKNVNRGENFSFWKAALHLSTPHPPSSFF